MGFLLFVLAVLGVPILAAWLVHNLITFKNKRGLNAETAGGLLVLQILGLLLGLLSSIAAWGWMYVIVQTLIVLLYTAAAALVLAWRKGWTNEFIEYLYQQPARVMARAQAQAKTVLSILPEEGIGLGEIRDRIQDLAHIQLPECFAQRIRLAKAIGTARRVLADAQKQLPNDRSKWKQDGDPALVTSVEETQARLERFLRAQGENELVIRRTVLGLGHLEVQAHELVTIGSPAVEIEASLASIIRDIEEVHTAVDEALQGLDQSAQEELQQFDDQLELVTLPPFSNSDTGEQLLEDAVSEVVEIHSSRSHS